MKLLLQFMLWLAYNYIVCHIHTHMTVFEMLCEIGGVRRSFFPLYINRVECVTTTQVDCNTLAVHNSHCAHAILRFANDKPN